MKENIQPTTETKSILNMKDVLDCFELKYNHQNLKNFAELINSGYTPLIVSNHQSHADGFPIALLTEKITDLTDENFNAFYFPIAASMATGHQNEPMKNYLEKVIPVLESKNLYLIPVTREKDEKEYGIKDKNFESIKKLLSAYKQGYGVIYCPEGSVRAGRNDGNGGINGMINVEENNSFDGTIERYLKKDIPFCVLQIAINGTHKFCNPDTYKIEIPDSKITLTVADEILTNEDFENKNIKPTELVMPKIAKILPFEARGIHK
ncbi:MAG: hypothetical protein WCG91_01725 [Candidatus Shapirobacteria bacterium]